MRGLLADNNADGHLNALLAVLQSADWRGFWDELRLRAFRFADLALRDSMPDDLLWEFCQREELILLTNNRNRSGQDSLDATIRVRNTVTALPVFTIANPRRVLRDRRYAEVVALRLLEILQDVDAVRGVGRLYLP
jgi:hypothetical protein